MINSEPRARLRVKGYLRTSVHHDDCGLSYIQHSAQLHIASFEYYSNADETRIRACARMYACMYARWQLIRER